MPMNVVSDKVTEVELCTSGSCHSHWIAMRSEDAVLAIRWHYAMTQDHVEPTAEHAILNIKLFFPSLSNAVWVRLCCQR